MEQVFTKIGMIIAVIMMIQCTGQENCIIQKGNVAYDFTFTYLADSILRQMILPICIESPNLLQPNI